MKKIFVIGLIFVGLFLGLKVFGAVNYERTPSGIEITSPVTINLTFDSIADFDWETTPPITLYYHIELNGAVFEGHESESVVGLCYSVAENSISEDFDLPVGDSYDAVWLVGYLDDVCTQESSESYTLEEDVDRVFTIISGTFIPISVGFVTSSLAYIGSAVTGLGPLLYMIIGIPLGFWVLRQVIGLIPRGKTKRE